MNDNNNEDQNLDILDEQTEENQSLATLQSVESMINSHLTRIERIRNDIKPIREMVRDYLENDEGYRELSEITKKASKEKGARKKELMNEPAGKNIQEKLDALTEELKDSQEALSTYLDQYRNLTGANEYEGPDGELRQIVYSAKLVRKTNLNR